MRGAGWWVAASGAHLEQLADGGVGGLEIGKRRARLTQQRRRDARLPQVHRREAARLEHLCVEPTFAEFSDGEARRLELLRLEAESLELAHALPIHGFNQPLLKASRPQLLLHVPNCSQCLSREAPLELGRREASRAQLLCREARHLEGFGRLPPVTDGLDEACIKARLLQLRCIEATLHQRERRVLLSPQAGCSVARRLQLADRCS